MVNKYVILIEDKGKIDQALLFTQSHDSCGIGISITIVMGREGLFVPLVR